MMIYRFIFVIYLLHSSHGDGEDLVVNNNSKSFNTDNSKVHHVKSGIDQNASVDSVDSVGKEPQSIDEKSSYKTWHKFSEFSDVIVHLVDWPYTHIKDECKILSMLGYGAVQISPVTEHAINRGRSWDERYSVTNYNINNDSGDERSLRDMIEKCNSLGISVFAEVVLNNMAKSTDKTKCGVSYSDKRYSDCHKIPFYTEDDFHKGCEIKDTDYATNIENVRTCELEHRHDLKQVNDKGEPNKHLVNFLTKLIKLGITGFRILAADHMDPSHLLKIYDRLPDITIPNSETKARPFIYQDVYDLHHNSDAVRVIKAVDYTERTRATDYKYAAEMSRTFLKRQNPLSYFKNWGTAWSLQESENSVVFIHNFITANYINRGFSFPENGWDFINTDDSDGLTAFKLATVFMLTHGHGIPLITSGFTFTKVAERIDSSGQILMKTTGKKFTGIHRLREIYSGVDFRKLVKSKNNGEFPPITNFIDHGEYQITYCVGDIGFVAFNNFQEHIPFDKEVQTCFKQPGIYCDVFGGTLNNNWEADKNPCTGKYIRVNENGMGKLNMDAYEGAALFHINSMKITRDEL
ncbi:alpha-amylase-related protein-like [Lycorma delicatula]|uniref:alpha-amylase-related protein-like n=1 Tax=Lycorma delicatula TaxID=130591 RepID=UPI003F512940